MSHYYDFENKDGTCTFALIFDGGEPHIEISAEVEDVAKGLAIYSAEISEDRARERTPEKTAPWHWQWASSSRRGIGST
jgi:hypothetical protein